ncbi:MAG: c-type cytochrome [Acidobacteriota bacterium]
MSSRYLLYTSAAGLFLVVLVLTLGLRATRADHALPVEPIASSPAQCFNPAARIHLTGKTCGAAPDLQLSCYLPADMVSPTPVPTPNQPVVLNLNTLQRAADLFSWQEFFALNWPANPAMRGEPDVTKKISDFGPRVWETWKEAYEVYLKDGAKPKPWNDTEPIPSACGDGVAKLFFRTQKIDDVVDSTVQAAAATDHYSAKLTDQKGKLVRYEIRLNKVLFDYVVQNQLYNANMQAQAKSVNFPNGAMLIKAAWREVSPAEEKLFHTVTACVCDKDQNGKLIKCRKQRMGLVGFHITAKTAFAPQWVWSTFEQVNNVPGYSATGADYSFYNASNPNLPQNRQTAAGAPNQLFRTIAIPNAEPDCADGTQAVDNVRLLNSEVRNALTKANSVFQYYELVNTQWPIPHIYTTSPTPPETVFTVRPVPLGNTTMESFVQPTSSCMGCHSTARTVNANNFVSSDFSFTLNNALPLQTNCKVIPPPTATPIPGKSTKWDQDNWDNILYGYALARQTYEMLPNYVPKAKLHCASCHLNAGGNSDAAWWADLRSEYPKTYKLQDRINHCFTNSLNGYPLCTPLANCDTNPYMNAFLIYIQWLEEQARTLKLCNTVPNGFPPIAAATPNEIAGQQVFIQKCAVCHQLDGQGRYEYSTYYRPALWGDHSFNKAAGMFTDLSNLAQFARWNMPLMAGGELSDQEAWDVATYIDKQQRPNTPGAKVFQK